MDDPQKEKETISTCSTNEKEKALNSAEITVHTQDAIVRVELISATEPARDLADRAERLFKEAVKETKSQRLIRGYS